MLFEENHIVNGDDCVTVGNGANGIHFRYAREYTQSPIRDTRVLIHFPPYVMTGIHTVKVDTGSLSAHLERGDKFPVCRMCCGSFSLSLRFDITLNKCSRHCSTQD